MTQFAGKLMFGTYCGCMIIVLINMLIAILTRAYETIDVRNDDTRIILKRRRGSTQLDSMITPFRGALRWNSGIQPHSRVILLKVVDPADWQTKIR